MPSEVVTSDPERLNAKLCRLNFDITLSERVLRDRVLVGGRYCSVDNRIAAQLKLEDCDGGFITCFLFKKKESFSFDETITKKHVEVELWDEDPLIVAVVHPK